MTLSAPFVGHDRIVRFTVSRASFALIDDLVIALDRDGQPIAETWRRVSVAAVEAGLPRPSYANVRRLVLAERRRRRDVSDVVQQTVATVAAGRVPALPRTLGRLNEASAHRPAEARVSETQGFEGSG